LPIMRAALSDRVLGALGAAAMSAMAAGAGASSRGWAGGAHRATTSRRRAGPLRTAQPPATKATRQAAIHREFKQAWEAGDIDALIGILDPAATATGDGGGLAPAVLRPIEGAEQIARFYAGRASAAPRNLTILERTVNGQPGLVAQQDGVTVAVLAFAVAGNRTHHIWRCSTLTSSGPGYGPTHRSDIGSMGETPSPSTADGAARDGRMSPGTTSGPHRSRPMNSTERLVPVPPMSAKGPGGDLHQWRAGRA
jgi:hypothetical protein